MHVTELTVATRLFLMARVLGNWFSDGFLVGYLGALREKAQVEAVVHLIDGNLQMHLALAPHQKLTGIGVRAIGQRWVFLRQL